MKTITQQKREFHSVYLTIRNGIDTTGDPEKIFERAVRWWRNQGNPPVYGTYAEFEADGVPATDPTDTRYGLWRPTGQALVEARAQVIREIRHYMQRHGVNAQVAYTEILRNKPDTFDSFEQFADSFDMNEHRRQLQQQFRNAVQTLKSARGYSEEKAYGIVASSRANVFTDYEQYKRLQP